MSTVRPLKKMALDLAQSAVFASSLTPTSASTVGSTTAMLELKNGSELEGSLDALKQQLQRQYQPVTLTNTKIGQRAARPPTFLLHPASSFYSPSPSSLSPS